MNIANILIFHGLARPICGGQSRYRNLTDRLTLRGNKVIVIEPEDFKDEMENESIEVTTYKELRLPRRSLCIFRDINPSFIESVARVLKHGNIDIVMISHPSGALITKILAKILGRTVPVVYDAHNFETEFIKETFSNDFKYSRLERLIIPIYVRVLERVTSRWVFDYITCVSERDREFFIAKPGISHDKVFVIPTGVRISSLPDRLDRERLRRKLGINPEAVVVAFHGIYSHPANREAFAQIAGPIAAALKQGNERILIRVGGTRVPKFEKGNLQSLGFIEDLHEFLSVADIAIVPISHGAGVKVKFFDYLSMGLPIVTTTKGAEGIKVKNGEDAVIVSDSDTDFIDAILALANSPSERARIGANGRRIAEEEYDWDAIGEKLDHLLTSLLGRSRPGA